MNINRRTFLKGIVASAAAAAFLPTIAFGQQKQLLPQSTFLLLFDVASFRKAHMLSQRHNHACVNTNAWWFWEDNTVWAAVNGNINPVTAAVRPAVPAAFMYSATSIVNLETREVIKDRESRSFEQITANPPHWVSELRPWNGIIPHM